MDIAARYQTPRSRMPYKGQIARIVELCNRCCTATEKAAILFSHSRSPMRFMRPWARRFEPMGSSSGSGQAYTQRILAIPAMRDWEASAKADRVRLNASHLVQDLRIACRRKRGFLGRFTIPASVKKRNAPGWRGVVASFAPEAGRGVKPNRPD